MTSVVKHWPKERHLANIVASGSFRHTREILVHHIETGNADRLVGIALSMGSVRDLLKRGVDEEEIGLPALRAVADRVLGGAQYLLNMAECTVENGEL